MPRLSGKNCSYEEAFEERSVCFDVWIINTFLRKFQSCNKCKFIPLIKKKFLRKNMLYLFHSGVSGKLSTGDNPVFQKKSQINSFNQVYVSQNVPRLAIGTDFFWFSTSIFSLHPNWTSSILLPLENFRLEESDLTEKPQFLWSMHQKNENGRTEKLPLITTWL